MMKTLVKLMYFMTYLGLVLACAQSDDVVDEMSDTSLKSGRTHTVTLPFEANFLGEYTNVIYPDSTCDESYNCRVFVDYTGTATHLGKMYGSFEFCACGPDDPNIEGPDGKYTGGETCFHAANGDKLFLRSEGSSVAYQMLPEHPEYVKSWWRDNWEITGGTGRFEGATGCGTSDDYNSSLDSYSHHHWTGTITMVKGKRK
ncbi:hypothetical protein [Saccharicrinis sp. GN24d3]|uniref:hypothetical protein n=1 Tax=Saccharicrinis sp. GN24d3 TaxID=3458416 RepID=UPI004036B00A